jgi:hypothetical protein
MIKQINANEAFDAFFKGMVVFILGVGVKRADKVVDNIDFLISAQAETRFEAKAFVERQQMINDQVRKEHENFDRRIITLEGRKR